MDKDTRQSRKTVRLVYDVPEAGAMLGLSRNASYDSAARGEIPTIRVGTTIEGTEGGISQVARHRERVNHCLQKDEGRPCGNRNRPSEF